jgi:hypothetical protein
MDQPHAFPSASAASIGLHLNPCVPWLIDLSPSAFPVVESNGIYARASQGWSCHRLSVVFVTLERSSSTTTLSNGVYTIEAASGGLEVFTGTPAFSSVLSPLVPLHMT